MSWRKRDKKSQKKNSPNPGMALKASPAGEVGLGHRNLSPGDGHPYEEAHVLPREWVAQGDTRMTAWEVAQCRNRITARRALRWDCVFWR